jgi:uncharacterized repeat protein (TIGR03847 family)
MKLGEPPAPAVRRAVVQLLLEVREGCTSAGAHEAPRGRRRAKEDESVTESFELSEPDRVTVGTVGPVGERMFVLQVREGRRLVTMKLEKGQVSTLCRYLGRLLRELERPGELPGGASLELEAFVEPDFVIGALGVAFDPEMDRIVLVCDEVDSTEEVEEGTPAPEPGATVRLAVTREQALALAIRGTELVEAGRPICPRCGYPLDPRGHVCPRMNGNAPPIT